MILLPKNLITKKIFAGFAFKEIQTRITAFYVIIWQVYRKCQLSLRQEVTDLLQGAHTNTRGAAVLSASLVSIYWKGRLFDKLTWKQVKPEIHFQMVLWI